MLTDKFDIGERLGIGATAEVFVATDLSSGAERALKVFTPLVLSDPDTVRRIESEVNALQRLSHPNIVRLFASHSAEEELALELELVRGSDLRAWRKAYDLHLNEPLLWILCQVAKGIGCAHEHGILHRDLKPENILISTTGDVKLTDFGLARQLDAVTMTKSGLLAGSLGFLAPEMLDGERCSPQSDLFSFGAIAYEILTGANPFAGPNPQSMMKKMFSGQFRPLSELAPGLPARVEQLVHDCLALDPRKRPASIWHVEAELMSVLSASALHRICKALVSRTARDSVLEGAFVEKLKELEVRLEAMPFEARTQRIQLAREWSHVFPDSTAPAEILAALPGDRGYAPWQRVGAALFLLLFLWTGWSLFRMIPRKEEAAPAPLAVAAPVVQESLPTTVSAAPTPPPAPAAKKPRGWIRVLADDDVTVFVDDKKIPQRLWNRIPTTPGDHKLKLVKDGFLPIENSISVSDGQVAVVRAKGGQ